MDNTGEHSRPPYISMDVEFKDVHFNDDEEDEIGDDIQHSNLLDSIAALSGKKRNIQPRMEISDPDFIKSSAKVSVGDLLGNQKDNRHLAGLKRKLSKQKVLETPLYKGEQEQIRRAIGYDAAVKVVAKWDPVVKENQRAKQMKFPLVQTELRIMDTTSNCAKNHKPRNALEQQIAEFTKANEAFIPDRRPLSKAEERALKAKSLQEAEIRRAELQKQRALLSYYGAKMKRQGKIKSKKYHRILRKSKEKSEANKLENLKDTDPEAYKEWLLREEKKRIEERMTLKHKATSKTMRKKTAYSKYDKDNRQAVQDMIQKSKELTTKKVMSDDSDSDESDASDDDETPETNPWLKKGSSVQAPKPSVAADMDVEIDSDDLGDISDEGEGGLSENLTRKRTWEEVEADTDDGDDEHLPSNKKPVKTTVAKINNPKQSGIRIEPRNVMKIDSETDQGLGNGGKNSRMTIAEAFADDDVVVKEFMAEKRDIIKRDQPKDMDFTLPGWDAWFGPGIAMKKKKGRTLKAPRLERKDKNLKNVIISETKDESIGKHQVSTLPYNFRNIHDFQNRIRKPIGKTWNPEGIYRNRIKPKCVVRIGTIIDPINADDVFKNAKGLPGKNDGLPGKKGLSAKKGNRRQKK